MELQSVLVLYADALGVNVQPRRRRANCSPAVDAGSVTDELSPSQPTRAARLFRSVRASHAFSTTTDPWPGKRRAAR